MVGLKRLVTVLLFNLGYLIYKVLLGDNEGPSQLSISSGGGERHTDRQRPTPGAFPAWGATLVLSKAGQPHLPT